MFCKSRVSEVISVALEVHAKVHRCGLIPLFTYSLCVTFSHALTGAVQNCDASCVQRTTELSAENVRVHGTHSPHPQSLQFVRLD